MMLSYLSIYHGWLGYILEKKKQGIDNMEFHPGVSKKQHVKFPEFLDFDLEISNGPNLIL